MHSSTKKNCMQRRYKSPFKDHSEYVVKIPLCYVYATLTQPCLSFSKKWWTVKKQISLPKFLSRKKIIIKWWQAFCDPCQINLLNLLKHGCEQQIQKQKSFIHLASICCPLTFCRNEKKNNTRSSVHNSNFNTMLLGPWEGKCTRNQAEQMQSFATSK